MDRLPANTILVDAASYHKLVEDLMLLRLRCEKQTALIETLNKNLASLKTGQ